MIIIMFIIVVSNKHVASLKLMGIDQTCKIHNHCNVVAKK